MAKSDKDKLRDQLLERDGTCCFYCGLEMENDITIEHLDARSNGGSNRLSNLVLAHGECNVAVGTLPISKKVQIAIRQRIRKKQRKGNKPYFVDIELDDFRLEVTARNKVEARKKAVERLKKRKPHTFISRDIKTGRRLIRVEEKIHYPGR